MPLPADRAAFYLTCLRADSARLAEVGRMGLSAEVPSCPGWTVEDVVRHTAEVYLHKIEAIHRNARPEPWPPNLADRDALELYDEATAKLIAELERVGPDAPSWTFWPADPTSGFWFRRMAQETAVHRVDAELAHDVVTPIDRGLALDGIDEILRVMLGGPWWEENDTRYPVDATVRVTANGQSWTIQASATAVTVMSAGPGTDLHGADDEVAAEIFGEADALLLWLWGRRGTDAVQVAGDDAVVESFRSRLSECTT
jgi:uncharacterized protein (TIGR03083 family)